jgi:hypothetical protein
MAESSGLSVVSDVTKAFMPFVLMPFIPAVIVVAITTMAAAIITINIWVCGSDIRIRVFRVRV